MRTQFRLFVIVIIATLFCGCTRSGYERANQAERKTFGPMDLDFELNYGGHRLDDVLARLGRPDRITKMSEAEALADYGSLLYGDRAVVVSDSRSSLVEIWRYDRQIGIRGEMAGDLTVDVVKEKVISTVGYLPSLTQEQMADPSFYRRPFNRIEAGMTMDELVAACGKPPITDPKGAYVGYWLGADKPGPMVRVWIKGDLVERALLHDGDSPVSADTAPLPLSFQNR